MLEILETHLRTAASPELADAITQACELFEDYELSGYQEAYTDLLMSSDNRDPSDTNASLVDLTTELQTQILDQMLILVDESITVQQANLLLKALRQLEVTELNDEISVLCDEVDADNALCEILAIVTGHEAEVFYPILHNVERCVLDRIKMISQQNITGDTVSLVDIDHVRKLIDRLIRFKNFTDKQLYIHDAILEGRAIDLPFAVYYSELWEKFVALQPQETAIQLLAIALVSGDACDNPRTAVIKALNETYSSADAITPIITALETLILKFYAEETSGVTRKTV